MKAGPGNEATGGLGTRKPHVIRILLKPDNMSWLEKLNDRLINPIIP